MPSPLLELPDEAKREREYIRQIRDVLCNRIDADLYETETDAAATQAVIEKLVTRMAVYRKHYGKADPNKVVMERLTMEGADLSSLSNWNVRERA